MESPAEFTASDDHSMILKRKRTKRQRPSSTSTSTSSTAAANSDGEGDCFTAPSPVSSGEISVANTEEDEDMANCLILLARGAFHSQLQEEDEGEGGGGGGEGKVVSLNRHGGKTGFYVYECKTCNRSFPSFQALGGHRASHKKQKTTQLEVENRAGKAEQNILEQGSKFAMLVSRGSDKHRMHECSICGSEFSSGQALGGHMRRHRVGPTSAKIGTYGAESDDDVDKKGNIVLALDLNLPAPVESDDDDDDFKEGINKFQFDRSKQCLVFSGPALVDCHY